MVSENVAHRNRKHCPSFLKRLPMVFPAVAHHFSKPWAMKIQLDNMPHIFQINPNSLAIWHASIEVRTFSLVRIFCRWRLTVCTLMEQCSAICLLIHPCAINRKTCTSLGESNRSESCLFSCCVCPVNACTTMPLAGTSTTNGL